MGGENPLRKAALMRLLRWLRVVAPPRIVPMVEPDPAALRAWRVLLSRKGHVSRKGLG